MKRDISFPVDDITQWQEFWVTIESGSILVDPNFDERDGTHAVNVYSGSSDTPVDATPFVITAAKGSDFGGGGAEESYIAIGAGATGRAGAFDVDFFSWAPGVHVPELMGVETMCAPLNTLAGDLDGDEEVGFSDFLLLSGTFGGSAPDGVNPYTVGDIDCSGGVDFADFLTLSGNFGMKLGGAQSVPEPAGAMIWLTGALLLLTRRKNRV